MERKEQEAKARRFRKVGLASAVYCIGARTSSSAAMRRGNIQRPSSFRGMLRVGTPALRDWTNGECEANCSLHDVVKAYAEVVPSFCRVAVAPVSHMHIPIGAKQKNSWS